MLYMFMLYWNEEKPLETSEPSISERLDFAKAAQARGGHVLSESLGGASNATTVRVRDGKSLVTDGPFLGTKEAMAGFCILECKDLDEALEYAARIPDAKYQGVEIRPVMDVPHAGLDHDGARDGGRTRRTRRSGRLASIFAPSSAVGGYQAAAEYKRHSMAKG
ncbi:MAG: YciI family protein [Chloroflexi bacterium]|nr:YciI family protein [Chloroflexota bacterium]MCI0889768.1 YciI family protein [Chloroflexota bacterium]